MGVGQGARKAEAMLVAAATGGEIALDGAELVAGNWVLAAQATLEATHSLDRLTSSWLRRIWTASLRLRCRVP
jgi:hypothetical protein